MNLTELNQQIILLRRQREIELEIEHAQGYVRQPQTAEEIEEWQPEQDGGKA